MKSKLIVSTLMIFSLLSLPVYKVVAQNNPSKLQWSDFKGEVEPNSRYAAMTYWGIKYHCEAQFIGDTAIVKVIVNYFLKDKSWVKPDWVKPGKHSDRLLNHEQGHLTIAEILSLEFEDEVMRNTYLKDSYKSTIDSIFLELFIKYSELELQYDSETQHMWNIVAQKKWDNLLEEKSLILKISEPFLD